MKLISYLKKNVMIIDIKDLSSSQKFHDKLTIDFFIQKDKYFTLYHSISEIITLFDKLIKENLFKIKINEEDIILTFLFLTLLKKKLIFQFQKKIKLYIIFFQKIINQKKKN